MVASVHLGPSPETKHTRLQRFLLARIIQDLGNS